MYDVRIINNEAILFDDDNMINLEHLRNGNGNIRYNFTDGSYVRIWVDNNILWFDSAGLCHRDDDMPAYIQTNGYITYCKHGKGHRECGPSVIWPDGEGQYWLVGIEYVKNEFIEQINSNYGMIYHA